MFLVDPCLQRSRNASGDLVVRLGVQSLDSYLEFLAVRSRPNSVLAVAYDLRVFFSVVGKRHAGRGRGKGCLPPPTTPGEGEIPAQCWPGDRERVQSSRALANGRWHDRDA